MCGKVKHIILITLIILILPSGCGKSSERQVDLSMADISFRDIPGVTEEEILAIEALQKENHTFLYGAVQSSEAFLTENGEVGGYTALFCEWLTNVFGLLFKPVHIDYSELFTVLLANEIDFSGDFRPTDERRQIYFMTDPIALRSLISIRIKDSQTIENISLSRLPRYALLGDSVAIQDVAAVLAPGSYETVVPEKPDGDYIYQMLNNNEIDVFIVVNSGESAFDQYDDVIVEPFFPSIYSPVSLTTGNDELAPIISVVQKALENGAYPFLAELYNQGYLEYKKQKLFKQFTKEELAYIQNTPTILFAAESDAYPHEFYNAYDKQWQGISFDLLDEVSKLTGLRFELAHDENVNWDDILKMFSNGEISLIVDTIHTKERENYFIWAETNALTDNYAFLSKNESRKNTVNDIIYLKVGLINSLAMEELFRDWFPFHVNVVKYENFDELQNGLERDEVDVILVNLNRLLALSNYYENPSYKADIIFDPPYYSGFGFNKDEVVLRSIVDKAFKLINAEEIKSYWKGKTFDYRTKVVEAQRPLLLSATFMFFIILVLVTALLIKNYMTGKQLENLVSQRTNELEIESSKLRTMFNSSPDIIFCKDLNSRYIQCNKSYSEMYDVSEEYVVGKTDREIFNYALETAQKFIEDDKKVMNTKQPAIFEESIVLKHKGNKELFLETIKAPLVQNGEVTGMLGISRDITERKAMEEQAQAANRAKSAFLANMSHEMRTPMNVVVGLTDLMLEEEDPKIDLKENLRKISTAGNTLLGLINDVLDISKIEAGKLELMLDKYEIPSLISDITTLNMIRIESKPIALCLDISGDLPYYLYGDDLRIKQIINNLLSNALKYTQRGIVTLGIECSSENLTQSEGGDVSGDVWMSAYVSDTGIGIREEDLKKLFIDYSQVDTRANRKIEGTGLGLSITKMLVEQMEGEISVKSEFGKGSTFRFRIKQGYVSDKTIGKETAEYLCSFRYLDRKKRAHEKIVRPDLSYASVLVVDDMQTNLDVAAGMLRKYKMQVDCVLNGQDAIDRIEDGKPVYDAIFMDHMMPGMDGVEAAKKIRDIGTRYAMTIPIIALTANAIAGNEQMFLNNNFQAFLAKPINIMHLDVVVKRWVRDKTRE